MKKRLPIILVAFLFTLTVITFVNSERSILASAKTKTYTINDILKLQNYAFMMDYYDVINQLQKNGYTDHNLMVSISEYGIIGVTGKYTRNLDLLKEGLNEAKSNYDYLNKNYKYMVSYAKKYKFNLQDTKAMLDDCKSLFDLYKKIIDICEDLSYSEKTSDTDSLIADDLTEFNNMLRGLNHSSDRYLQLYNLIQNYK